MKGNNKDKNMNERIRKKTGKMQQFNKTSYFINTSNKIEKSLDRL